MSISFLAFYKFRCTNSICSYVNVFKAVSKSLMPPEAAIYIPYHSFDSEYFNVAYFNFDKIRTSTYWILNIKIIILFTS